MYLKISVTKDLTANCLEETSTKFELILAAVVECGLNRVQLPLWLQQSTIMVFYCLICLGPKWSVKICKMSCKNQLLWGEGRWEGKS